MTKPSLAPALLLLAALSPLGAGSFSFGPSPPPPPPPPSRDAAAASSVPRRQSFGLIASAAAAAAAAGVAAAPPTLPASAVVTDETPRVTTRMGGLLEPYQDQRGWKILAPSGWNKFEGEVGAYDVKWQDLVDPTENVKISSTPVKSTTTSISVIGEDVQEVGARLASKRNAKLVRATERQTDGVLFYAFEFALGDGTHQILQLCVNKGKIWSLDANAKERRWGKREEMYNNIVGSFMPKLS